MEIPPIYLTGSWILPVCACVVRKIPKMNTSLASNIFEMRVSDFISDRINQKWFLYQYY
jgi:hypothetical protein